jgi:hypothetical protein
MKQWGALLVLAAGFATAADRDFLTAEEVDKVRLAQEPNARIQLYLSFAQQRLAQLEQLLSKERAGRSTLVHDLLEDYTNIIDALDTVTDDALRRRIDMTKGLTVVMPAEKLLLARLAKLDEAEYADRARFAFVLMDAIEATEGSLELAGDLPQRAKDLAARDKRESDVRKEGNLPESTSSPGKEQAEETKGQTKKAPTLRRPTDPPRKP